MSTRRSYQEPTPTTFEAVRTNLGAGDLAAATFGMVGLAFHEPDWRRCQELFLGLLDHPDHNVRGTAAICLGHLARLHHELDTDRVLPALRARLDDPQMGGIADDAIEDIEQFVR